MIVERPWEKCKLRKKQCRKKQFRKVQEEAFAGRFGSTPAITGLVGMLHTWHRRNLQRVWLSRNVAPQSGNGFQPLLRRLSSLRYVSAILTRPELEQLQTCFKGHTLYQRTLNFSICELCRISVASVVFFFLEVFSILW